MKKRAKWKGRKAPALVWNEDLKAALALYGVAILLLVVLAIIGSLL